MSGRTRPRCSKSAGCRWCVCGPRSIRERGLTRVVLRQTSLASRALDGMTDREIREGVTAELLRYLHTDTTWYARPTARCLPSTLPLIRFYSTVSQASPPTGPRPSSSCRTRTGLPCTRGTATRTASTSGRTTCSSSAGSSGSSNIRTRRPSWPSSCVDSTSSRWPVSRGGSSNPTLH